MKDFSVDAEVFFSFRDFLDDGFGLYRVVRVKDFLFSTWPDLTVTKVME